MKTVADPDVVRLLKDRFARLTPDTARRWGTLTAHEMLCHLGDSFEMALRIRPRLTPVAARNRGLIKLVGLWTAARWPHGWRTNPHQDPRADGTQPSQFVADRTRVLAAIEKLQSPDPHSLEVAHGVFGRMSVADWQRWTWKHADHHLRQFGV